ncbi:hypothetical protein RIR_jg31839.t1 [Rhizophagus irregularis DAOM 181602=DAOM 197198]|nr:hypothetical protein RIR_jg31839.t1 [Rhizophagus irregularis DAOM 181602=DAOM 197198]
MNLYDDDNPKKKLKTFEEASEESARTPRHPTSETYEMSITKPTLSEHSIQYLAKHISVNVNNQCVIMGLSMHYRPRRVYTASNNQNWGRKY